MIDIGFFYLLLLILLIFLLLIILLYSNGHYRPIISSFLDGNYGLSTPIANLDGTFRPVDLVNNNLGTSGSYNFNSNSIIPFNFKPLSVDRKRNINGNLVMLSQSYGTSIYFSLRLRDLGNNEIVGDETNFILYPDEEYGLQTIKLIFSAPYSENNHNFSLEAKALEPTPSFIGTSLLINSAYFNYY
jgi:hypothetical protein